ncbi:MAG: hypothetical protein U1A78_23110 [Polyangia bacterium]
MKKLTLTALLTLISGGCANEDLYNNLFPDSGVAATAPKMDGSVHPDLSSITDLKSPSPPSLHPLWDEGFSPQKKSPSSTFSVTDSAIWYLEDNNGSKAVIGSICPTNNPGPSTDETTVQALRFIFNSTSVKGLTAEGYFSQNTTEPIGINNEGGSLIIPYRVMTTGGASMGLTAEVLAHPNDQVVDIPRPPSPVSLMKPTDSPIVSFGPVPLLPPLDMGMYRKNTDPIRGVRLIATCNGPMGSTCCLRITRLQLCRGMNNDCGKAERGEKLLVVPSPS